MHAPPRMCQTRVGVGVCVTGEARSFALSSVRGSLKELLTEIGAVAVRLEISRRASSSLGWTHAHDRTLRTESIRNLTFSFGPQEIAREFVRWNASVTILDASNCKQPEWRMDECCQLALRMNTSLAERFAPGWSACMCSSRDQQLGWRKSDGIDHRSNFAFEIVVLLGARR